MIQVTIGDSLAEMHEESYVEDSHMNLLISPKKLVNAVMKCVSATCSNRQMMVAFRSQDDAIWKNDVEGVIILVATKTTLALEVRRQAAA